MEAFYRNKEGFILENGKRKKEDPGGDKAKAVQGWARATEYTAKALVAVVGLVALILLQFGKK